VDSSSNSDAIWVLVLGGVLFSALVAWVVWRRVRLRRRVAAAGADAIRVRMRASRHGYAAGLVPVVEELLDRVERLEAELADLKRDDEK
jgi:flagellar biosynthesis/type III secretory pathway M-ring protein FliF/YscJ